LTLSLPFRQVDLGLDFDAMQEKENNIKQQ
jgi:hypothetical protein